MRPVSTPQQLIAGRHVVDEQTGCWNWTGYRDRKGYGRVGIGGRRGRTTGAHRLSLIAEGIPLNDSDIVMHRCDNPACVNPAHLMVGTQSDNIRDMYAKGRASTDPRGGWKKSPEAVLRGEQHPMFGKRMSHCKRGHALIDGSFYRDSDGHRRCSECHRMRSLRSYHKRKSTGEE